MANETKRLLERVRALREVRELSQEAFAERAGLKYKHYQAIEAGRKPDFKMSTLFKLAKACAVEPWELLNSESMNLKVAEEAEPYAREALRARRKG